MNDTKEKKLKLQIIISVLIMTAILFSEMYLMINFKESYIPIVALAVIAMGTVYTCINAILKLNELKEIKREEHFQNIYKSEKASYIMLKKSFGEVDEKLNELRESSKVSAEETINAQKGVAKIIINRSKENTDAIVNSNEQVLGRLDEIEETHNTKFSSFSTEQGLKLSDMGTQTDMRIQELIDQLKDVESRLNQAIMSSTRVEISNPIDNLQTEVESVEEPVVQTVLEAEPVVEEELVVEEEKPTMPDLSDPNKMMSADDIAALLANMDSEAEPVLEEELVVEEEKPAMPDLSDPNKMMSADDIAALLANMETEAEPVEEEESIIEEEKPAMPDLSDPNKMMSPDDIAALLANMEPEPEPVEEIVEEEKPAMPDLSDPNKMMSADDIAALLANMEPEAEPVEEPIIEEEKPAMPDLSDPNKMMSPDDIAALIANL